MESRHIASALALQRALNRSRDMHDRVPPPKVLACQLAQGGRCDDKG